MMHDQKLYDRIIARIRKDDATGCWNWTGPAHTKRPYPGNRYGYVQAYGGAMGTHRAMWSALYGRPGRIVYICHRCDNPLCMNPEHLFAGAPRDNTQDMIAKNRHNNGKKTICKRGHPLEGPNLEIKADGARDCRICATGRYRLRAGWPESMAFDPTIKVPGGYMVDRATGQIVPGRGRRKSLQTNQ